MSPERVVLLGNDKGRNDILVSVPTNPPYTFTPDAILKLAYRSVVAVGLYNPAASQNCEPAFALDSWVASAAAGSASVHEVPTADPEPRGVT